MVEISPIETNMKNYPRISLRILVEEIAEIQGSKCIGKGHLQYTIMK